MLIVLAYTCTGSVRNLVIMLPSLWILVNILCVLDERQIVPKGVKTRLVRGIWTNDIEVNSIAWLSLSLSLVVIFLVQKLTCYYHIFPTPLFDWLVYWSFRLISYKHKMPNNQKQTLQSRSLFCIEKIPCSKFASNIPCEEEENSIAILKLHCFYQWLKIFQGY